MGPSAARWLAIVGLVCLTCVCPGGLGDAAVDVEAEELIARVLETNRPWLTPKPVHATYSLRRRTGDAAEPEVLGPFSSDLRGAASARGSAGRVGSILWTPLHAMAQDPSGYTARRVAQGKWNGREVEVIHVLFGLPARCAIGMGGQGRTSYSSGSFPAQSARLTIDRAQALPLLIESLPPPTDNWWVSTWRMEEGFFAVDGGLAPKVLEFNDPSFVRQRQEFQLLGSVWLFKRGEAWRGEHGLVAGEAKWIHEIELIQWTRSQPDAEPPADDDQPEEAGKSKAPDEKKP